MRGGEGGIDHGFGEGEGGEHGSVEEEGRGWEGGGRQSMREGGGEGGIYRYGFGELIKGRGGGRSWI